MYSSMDLWNYGVAGWRLPVLDGLVGPLCACTVGTQSRRPIVQAAAACRATHLLTGDLRDFARLMNRLETTFSEGEIKTIRNDIKTILLSAVWRAPREEDPGSSPG